MIKRILTACVTAVRPILGPPGCCRYELPCSDFAQMELKDKSLSRALFSISQRVISCNPLTAFMLRISKN